MTHCLYVNRKLDLDQIQQQDKAVLDAVMETLPDATHVGSGSDFASRDMDFDLKDEPGAQFLLQIEQRLKDAGLSDVHVSYELEDFDD